MKQARNIRFTTPALFRTATAGLLALVLGFSPLTASAQQAAVGGACTTGNVSTDLNANGVACKASVWVANVYADATGNVGIGTTTPSTNLDVIGSIKYTGIITDVSDIRLKENVRPLNGSLNKILAIDGIAYQMINDPHHGTEFGFSAQAMERIVPELVQTADNDTQIKSVNYIGLIPVITEAIKELKADNEALRVRLNHLEQKNSKEPSAP
jgi:Chaperone of endosialidase